MQCLLKALIFQYIDNSDSVNSKIFWVPFPKFNLITPSLVPLVRKKKSWTVENMVKYAYQDHNFLVTKHYYYILFSQAWRSCLPNVVFMAQQPVITLFLFLKKLGMSSNETILENFFLLRSFSLFFNKKFFKVLKRDIVSS